MAADRVVVQLVAVLVLGQAPAVQALLVRAPAVKGAAAARAAVERHRPANEHRQGQARISKPINGNRRDCAGYLLNFLAIVLITSKVHHGAPIGSGSTKAIVGTALIVFITLLCGRMAWTAVFAKPDSIRVANMFSSFDLSSGEIQRFDIGRSRVLPYVCRIHTKDGKVRYAIGVEESTNFKTGSAARLAAELNDELAIRTRELEGRRGAS